MPSFFEIVLYYPVTAILWFWHKAFGFVFGEASTISWVLGIVFLTFTVRAIMFKPFVHQVRSMKKMQDFAPEMKKIQKRYANDKQRQMAAMQKLQREHGVNPLGGCLPILVQIPVFIGLNHVLRSFAIHFYDRPNWGLYTFSRAGVEQYMNAKFFQGWFGEHAATLGQAIYTTSIGGTSHPALEGYHPEAIIVALPLMVAASILTHFTARHSVERQNPAAASEQTAIMNKLTLWVFPVGLLAFGAFLPIGLLIYFLANNFWTLMQQRVVYRKIDAEEEAKKTEAIEKRSNLAPKPGQKPKNPKKGPAAQTNKQDPGQAKPKQGDDPAKGQDKKNAASSNGQGKPATGKDSNGASGDADGDVPGIVRKTPKKKSGRKRR